MSGSLEFEMSSALALDSIILIGFYLISEFKLDPDGLHMLSAYDENLKNPLAGGTAMEGLDLRRPIGGAGLDLSKLQSSTPDPAASGTLSLEGNEDLLASRKIAARYQCSECGKCCTTKWKLDTHFRVHSGERPFECEICGKKFNAKGNMRTHMITHYK